MKMSNKKVFLVMLIFSIYFAYGYSKWHQPDARGHKFQDARVVLAGPLGAIAEIKQNIQGIKKFFDYISFGFQVIYNFAGLDVILFLIFILLLSSLLSLFGIPRGRGLFLVSLLAADVLWLISSKSFAGKTFSLLSLLRINFIIALPYLTIYLFRIITPKVTGKAITILSGKLSFLRNSSLNKRELVSFSEKFNHLALQFQNSLLRDISRDTNEKILLTGKTKNHLADMKRLISEFPAQQKNG